MNLIIGENLPPRWCDYLSSFGIIATHWRDIGTIGDSDDVIFDHACIHQKIIITQDLDFTHLLPRRSIQLPSVIQLRVDFPNPEIIGSSLLKVLNRHEEQLREGCLISMDHRRHRLRLLPLY